MGNVSNKERKEKAGKDVKQSKKLSGTEKKVRPWKKDRGTGRRTLEKLKWTDKKKCTGMMS